MIVHLRNITETGVYQLCDLNNGLGGNAVTKAVEANEIQHVEITGNVWIQGSWFLDWLGEGSVTAKKAPKVSSKQESISPAVAGIDPFPVQGGGEWILTVETLTLFCKSYSSLRPESWVVSNIKAAHRWLISNPANVKKSTGMRRYLGGWLARTLKKEQEEEAKAEKNKSSRRIF